MNRRAAALAASLFAVSFAATSFADEPVKGRPNAPDDDRGSVSSLPGATSSAPATAPATTGTAPATTGVAQSAPQLPPSDGAAPNQGPSPYTYPPPAYGQYPGGYPPGYSPYPPPGYSPYPVPPVAGPYVVDGAKAYDYKPEKKRRRRHVESGPPDPARRQKRIGKLLMIGGVGGLGLGWVGAVIHGVVGEIAGVECHSSTWGFPSCSNTDDYGPIYIPVVGPILEAANHRGDLSGADQIGLALETVFQIGGVGAMIAGFTVYVSAPDGEAVPGASGVPMAPAPTGASMPVTLSVAPMVGQHTTGLSVLGTF